MTTLHERAVALSESWGCSYKEALEVERQFDALKPVLGLKTKEAALEPKNFWEFIAPGANQQPRRPASFGEFLGFPI